MTVAVTSTWKKHVNYCRSALQNLCERITEGNQRLLPLKRSLGFKLFHHKTYCVMPVAIHLWWLKESSKTHPPENLTHTVRTQQTLVLFSLWIFLTNPLNPLASWQPWTLPTSTCTTKALLNHKNLKCPTLKKLTKPTETVVSTKNSDGREKNEADGWSETLNAMWAGEVFEKKAGNTCGRIGLWREQQVAALG